MGVAVMGYASRTGTKKNLRYLEEAGWGLMVSAKGVLRTEGFPYVLDCGAWWAFQNGLPFDEAAFEKALALLGRDALWIVLPDIVLGGMASLALSRKWLRKLRRRKAFRDTVFLLAVQNGMEPKHVKRLLGPKVGVFVGGDTEWKVATMKMWAELAHSRGAICHVGRVNTPRRVKMCADADVDSFDGSGPSRYSKTLPALDIARRQPDMFGHRRMALPAHGALLRQDETSRALRMNQNEAA